MPLDSLSVCFCTFTVLVILSLLKFTFLEKIITKPGVLNGSTEIVKVT